MESMMDWGKQLEAMQERVTRRGVAIRELGTVLEDHAESQRRREQVAVIQRLRERIVRDVEEVRRSELIAESGQHACRAAVGFGSLLAGSLLSATRGKEGPRLAGVRVARQLFSESTSFGSVAVAVGKEGVPDDVAVVAVSRLARESFRSEAEARAKLQADGCEVMTPEVFVKNLARLEGRLLDGSASLPAHISDLPTKAVTLKLKA